MVSLGDLRVGLYVGDVKGIEKLQKQMDKVGESVGENIKNSIENSQIPTPNIEEEGGFFSGISGTLSEILTTLGVSISIGILIYKAFQSVSNTIEQIVDILATFLKPIAYILNVFLKTFVIAMMPLIKILMMIFKPFYKQLLERQRERINKFKKGEISREQFILGGFVDVIATLQDFLFVVLSKVIGELVKALIGLQIFLQKVLIVLMTGVVSLLLEGIKILASILAAPLGKSKEVEMFFGKVREGLVSGLEKTLTVLGSNEEFMKSGIDAVVRELSNKLLEREGGLSLLSTSNLSNTLLEIISGVFGEDFQEAVSNANEKVSELRDALEKAAPDLDELSSYMISFNQAISQGKNPITELTKIIQKLGTRSNQAYNEIKRALEKAKSINNTKDFDLSDYFDNPFTFRYPVNYTPRNLNFTPASNTTIYANVDIRTGKVSYEVERGIRNALRSRGGR